MAKISLISKYLELEQLLNHFFNQVNYCKPNCIDSKDTKILRMGRSRFTTGCCDGNAFLSDFRSHMNLHEERKKIYGEPKDKGIERCGYHAEEGCILKTHKPVLCIAYACPEFEEYLKLNFKVKYNYSEIKRSLSDILNGEDAEKGFNEIKQRITGYIQKTNKPAKQAIFCKYSAHFSDKTKL